MGILDGLMSAISGVKEADLEEVSNDLEMEHTDVLHAPADFYVKPITLENEESVRVALSELANRHLIVMNVPLAEKNKAKQKMLVEMLKEAIRKMDGDLGKVNEQTMLLTPRKVKIARRKR